MSTSSKILQNQLEAVKKSPRKSHNLSTSPRLTPRSKNNSSSDSQQYEPDELLKLQIKQIKRQNNFLKKKVNELIAQLSNDRPLKKKTSKMGLPKQNKDLTHITIDFFFQQINELLKSVISAFHIQFTSDQVKKFQQRHSDDDNIYGEPIKNYAVLKKFTLNKRLSKIMLEQEEKRYPELLQIFSLYYKTKEDADKYVRGIVDKMTKKALQLNKMIVERAQRKSHKAPKSHHHFQYQDAFYQKSQNMKMQPLSLPWTSVRLATSGSDTNEKKPSIKRVSRITSPLQQNKK